MATVTREMVAAFEAAERRAAERAAAGESLPDVAPELCDECLAVVAACRCRPATDPQRGGVVYTAYSGLEFVESAATLEGLVAGCRELVEGTGETLAVYRTHEDESEYRVGRILPSGQFVRA